MEDKKRLIKSISITFPVIVKPAKCGSSIGINIANDIKELNKNLKEAFKYDDKVIIKIAKDNPTSQIAIVDQNDKVYSLISLTEAISNTEETHY